MVAPRSHKPMPLRSMVRFHHPQQKKCFKKSFDRMKNSSYLCETNAVGVEIKVEVTLPPVKKVLKKKLSQKFGSSKKLS